MSRFLLLCALLFALSASGAETKTNSARVKVSGYGVLPNREMVRLLRNFSGEEKLPPTLDRTFVEDAALVLFARAKRDGYLDAKLSAKFKLPDGTVQDFAWTNEIFELPQNFAATEARFRIQRGERFRYGTLRIEGLHVISQREARNYFIGADTLLVIRANRVYTPESLKGSMAALKQAYARRGYRETAIIAKEIRRDDPNSGAMTVVIEVQEGLPSAIRSVDVTVELSGKTPVTNRWMLHPKKVYSDSNEQAIRRELQESFLKLGYPDTATEFSVVKRDPGPTNIQVDLAARLHTGPLIKLGEVHFDGNRETRVSVIQSRVNLKEGEPLNRLDAEKSRQRLARLGVFDSVGLHYEKVDDETRNVLYSVKEGKEMTLSVLAGYGSYELLRGGLEFEHHNIWGLAHDFRMRGIESFKASSGDAQYTIPEIFGENVDYFIRGSGLLRDEVTFTRKEAGASTGILKRFIERHVELSVHYDYEFLRAQDLDNASTNFLGVTDARAATFNIEVTRDRRDNPLLPTKGLKLFSKFEVASTALGGNVNYQLLLLSGSYHIDLTGGRLLHLGITHGVTFTLGGSSEELPFNKRFFPGGENSLRGYQEGEASPLDANGKQLGAETYTVGNFEFEQLLTHTWSLVGFFDVGGIAKDRSDYPWDEVLYCAGGGIRWRSPIGPVRLEYGYNLNPRPRDPTGTLHFSIGFPF